MNSKAIDDYLKALFALEQREQPVSTSALAERMGITSASVTSMLKRLATRRPRLIDYRPYYGAALTRAGKHQALQVIRHHRLIESYLSQALGYHWDEVHDEAEVLEHAISPALAERMAAALHHPVTDPHGEPIPSRDGKIAAPEGVRLSSLSVGQRGTVCRVGDATPELLRHLDQIGLRLGARVEVVARDAFSGTLKVRLLAFDAGAGAVQSVESWIADAVCACLPDPAEAQPETKPAHSPVLSERHTRRAPRE